MERVTWKLTSPYVKIDNQWEFAVYLRKFKQGLCITERGGMGGGRWEGVSKGRGYVYLWLI